MLGPKNNSKGVHIAQDHMHFNSTRLIGSYAKR